MMDATATSPMPPGADLLDADVAALRQALTARDVSARELCEGLLDRAHQWEPYLNAFITLDESHVLSQARAADEHCASGTSRTSLAGIPIAVKDNFDVCDLPTTAGSRCTPDRAAREDSVVVSRMRSAGAVIFGKTNLPELAYGPVDSYHFGPTSNPWRPGHFAGGSSMGSGAAVAARIVPAAIGSDTTGSIRNPACWCGVTGLKPTHGLVSLLGMVPLAPSLDHAGPLARSALDCAILLDALASHCSGDPSSPTRAIGNHRFEAAAQAGRSDVRVGVLSALFDELPADTALAIEQALASLARRGATLVEVSLTGWNIAVEDALLITQVQAAAAHGHLLSAGLDVLQHQVRKRLEDGLQVEAVDYARACERARNFGRDVAAMFGELDVLALPARERTAPPMDANGRRASGESGARFTAPLNLTGSPALVMPCGFDELGLPIGIQLASARWRDGLLLAVAHAFQCESDWHRRGPALPVAPIGPGEAASRGRRLSMPAANRPASGIPATSTIADTTKGRTMSDTNKPLIVRRGDGTRFRQGPSIFMASGHETGGRFDFFEMNVEYLTGPGLHWHAFQEDAFYVLDGVMTVQCYDEIFEVGPGDFISIPPRTPHTFDNTNPNQPPVRVLNLMTPGGYDGLFAETEALGSDSTPEEMDAINARYDVTYVGPTLAETLGLSR